MALHSLTNYCQENQVVCQQQKPRTPSLLVAAQSICCACLDDEPRTQQLGSDMIDGNRGDFEGL